MSFRRRPGQRGLSLVDILLTQLLAVIVCATPFAISWLNSMHVERSKGALIQASHHARALALRYADPAHGGTPVLSVPVAGIKLLPNAIVLVCRKDPSDSNCREGGSNVEWRADLSRGVGVAVTINQQNEVIFGFDQTGALLAAADFRISKGTEYKAGQLN